MQVLPVMIISVGRTAARTRMPVCAAIGGATVLSTVSEQIKFRVCPNRKETVVKDITQLELFEVLKKVARVY